MEAPVGRISHCSAPEGGSSRCSALPTACPKLYPMAAAASTSESQCRPSYTRESPVIAAAPYSTAAHADGSSSVRSNAAEIANAIAVCPEGKLCRASSHAGGLQRIASGAWSGRHRPSATLSATTTAALAPAAPATAIPACRQRSCRATHPPAYSTAASTNGVHRSPYTRTP